MPKLEPEDSHIYTPERPRSVGAQLAIVALFVFLGIYGVFLFLYMMGLL